MHSGALFLAQCSNCTVKVAEVDQLKGLEHKSDGKWLREMGLFSLGEKEAQGRPQCSLSNSSKGGCGEVRSASAPS